MSWIKDTLEKFLVLRDAPRELWVIYAAKVMAIISYGLMSTTLTLWLSSDLGFSDAHAGDMYAVWSSIITLVTLLVGSLVDAVGIRRSFLAGFVLIVFSRFFLFDSTSVWIAIPFGLVITAVGEAFMVPVMSAGVKMFSNVRQRSTAFSLFYVLMNVGFLIAGWLFDVLRKELGETGTTAVPFFGDLSTYQVLLLLSFLSAIPGLLLTYFFLRDGVEMTEEGVTITAREKKYGDATFVQATLWTMRDTLQDTVKTFVGVWKQPAFFRFLLFLTLLVFVKVVFYHMHATFPKYGIRELGAGAPVGQLWSVLNPAIIIVLVPIVGVLSSRVTSYAMIAVGTVIASSSVFFLAMPAAWFDGLAQGTVGHLIAHSWLGLDPAVAVNPLYVSITLFVILFSIGEAIWSPRLYEYTASIAPEGQVGSYMALSLLPYFVAKFVVGIMSGRLLQAYCPAEGPRDSGTMWLIIALMAMIAPVGIIVLKKYIRSEEAGRGELAS
ncbi:MAG: MFS transporter [Deltaproteobacteria bacterium]|nr:MFS transporter [Deltaproteobacteria bacterium]